MGISFDFSPIAVHKSPRIPQAFAEKRFELIPRNQESAVCVLLPLVLLPTEADLVTKERRSKGKLVNTLNPSGSKVIFTLLTEVVAFYMGPTVIYIWGTSFQGLISKLLKGGGSSSL